MSNIQKILNTKPSDYPRLVKALSGELESEKYFCPREHNVTESAKFFGKESRLVAGYSNLVLDDDFAYAVLFDKLKDEQMNICRNNKIDDKAVCKLVQEAVFEYFGTGRPDDLGRTYLYNAAYQDGRIVSIREFCGNGKAMCLERASLAQNYFKLLGYDSKLMGGDISLNGSVDLHTYNVVSLSDGDYVFDLVCSKIVDGPMPSPLMTRLGSGEYYDKVTFVSQSGRTNTIEYKDLKPQVSRSLAEVPKL